MRSLALLASLIAFFSHVARAEDWRMIWSDEFEAEGRINSADWSYMVGDGSVEGTGEIEYYTDRTENVHIKDGKLIIEARKESYKNSSYTSGRIHTHAAWLYGRIEIRAKLPLGGGVWPAFWMLPLKHTYGRHFWPDNGEMDIVEYFGANPGFAQATFHTEAYNWIKGNQVTQTLSIAKTEDDYHVFALEWGPDKASMFVDDRIYNQFINPGTGWKEWPFNEPFQIILNFAVGGAGGAIDDSLFPQQFVIDYVRVYQPVLPPAIASLLE